MLSKLCSKFVQEHNDEAGSEALNYLDRSAEVPSDVAKQCLDLLVKSRDVRNTKLQDEIVAGLLRESPAAKVALAKKLHDNITKITFEEICRIGDNSSNSLTTVVLDPAVWSGESNRYECLKDVFLLYLAKVYEVGDELNYRALRGVARLLVADTKFLAPLIDEETFDVILTHLDNRNSIELRSQAVLVTAKYLEAFGEAGQTTLNRFVSSRIGRQRNEDLVLAFSAAAGVFPVAPSIASTLFLTDGFVQELVPLLEKKAKSEKVEHAALDMLSAACIDSACRQSIKQHCTTWLQQILEIGEGERAALAGVILAKTQGPSSQTKNPKNQDTGEADLTTNLTSHLKRMMLGDSIDSKQTSIEGLAYASVQPKVKEQLAKDGSFLNTLVQDLKNSPSTSPVIFGGLTIFDNLSRYLPTLSEEQKSISQIKAFASASKAPPQADPLDEADAVEARCKAIVAAGAVSVLVSISKTLSPGSVSMVFSILLSLSKTSSLRGIIAQQGGIRLLLQKYNLINGDSTAEIQSRRTAAHALSRILMSIDPALVFPSSGSMPLTYAVRPLLSLLKEDPSLDSQGPRDLLPTFEALIALANLASVPSGGASEAIIRLDFPTIEDLLTNRNARVQCAATELVCNLVNCAAGAELFADGSPSAKRRLHILLALADGEDMGIRRAAGGALASLTEFEGTVKAVMARKSGMEILVGLCEGDDEGIVHRGLVCIKNACSVEGEIGRLARQKVMDLQGLDLISDIAQDYKETKGPLLEPLVDAITALLKGR